MRVRFSPRARDDIEQIFQYLNPRSPSGAENVLRDIYETMRLIAEQPEGALRTDNPAIRVKIVRRYRYKIFYRIGEEAVDVLHVRHSSRWPWRGTKNR